MENSPFYSTSKRVFLLLATNLFCCSGLKSRNRNPAPSRRGVPPKPSSPESFCSQGIAAMTSSRSRARALTQISHYTFAPPSESLSPLVFLSSALPGALMKALFHLLDSFFFFPFKYYFFVLLKI